MTVAPIDRLENVRASVADVERQMNACRAAGVAFPDVFAWRLLSECISLLGRAEDVPNLIRQAKAEAWEVGRDARLTQRFHHRHRERRSRPVRRPRRG